MISEQQPLRLNPAEVCEVIAAVCSETSPNANVMTMSTRLNSHRGKTSMDVAVSVLVKLIIDMYVLIPLAGIISSSFHIMHLSTLFLILIFYSRYPIGLDWTLVFNFKNPI